MDPNDFACWMIQHKMRWVLIVILVCALPMYVFSNIFKSVQNSYKEWLTELKTIKSWK